MLAVPAPLLLARAALDNVGQDGQASSPTHSCPHPLRGGTGGRCSRTAQPHAEDQHRHQAEQEPPGEQEEDETDGREHEVLLSAGDGPTLVCVCIERAVRRAKGRE